MKVAPLARRRVVLVGAVAASVLGATRGPGVSFCPYGEGGGLRPVQLSRRSHLPRIALRGEATGTSERCGCAGAVEVISERWAEEARRAWGAAPDGEVPGYIAIMLDPGSELLLDPALKTPIPRRKWKRLEGPRVEQRLLPALTTREDTIIYYYSGKTPSDTLDVVKKDINLAIAFFEKDPVAGGSSRSGVVVDVGCADAFFARSLARTDRFDLVFGVDVSPPQLAHARKSAEEERTGPDDGLLLLQADVADLPFADGKVDCVWWGLGLHIVKDPEAALRSIFRVLRPGGGRLMATTLQEFYPAKMLSQMLEEAGFQVESMRMPRQAVIALQATKP